jgi:hypothetical protein
MHRDRNHAQRPMRREGTNEILGSRFAVIRVGNVVHRRAGALPGRKTDVNDATWIADLVAHGLVRSSFVPPTAIQELRDLTRTRKHSSLIRRVTGPQISGCCASIWNQSRLLRGFFAAADARLLFLRPAIAILP